MPNEIMKRIKELRAEAQEARALAATFSHAATVADLEKYATALENDIAALEAEDAIPHAETTSLFLLRPSYAARV